MYDAGHLIEQGNHEELLALDGLYADLYRQQASYYQDESQSVDNNNIPNLSTVFSKMKISLSLF